MTTTIEAPPAIRGVFPGDTVWLTDRTGPWIVLSIQGDRALLRVEGSVITAWVLLTDIGRVKGRS